MTPNMNALAAHSGIVLCVCINLPAAPAATIDMVMGGFVIDEDPKDGVPDAVIAGPPVATTIIEVANDLDTPVNIFEDEERGVVEFDISGFTFPIASANITLRHFRTTLFPSTVTNYEVFGYAGNGTVDLADYSAGALAASFQRTGTGLGAPMALDVTAAVNSALGSSANFVGFNIRQIEERSDGDAEFSRFGVPVLGHEHPVLMIVAVPEPSALGAFVGLGVLILRYRFKGCS